MKKKKKKSNKFCKFNNKKVKAAKTVSKIQIKYAKTVP